jgi:Predicted GTPases
MLQCFPRGKRSEVAVGDRVIYEPTSADQGVIVEIGERRNLLYRSDQYKSKLFAANLDQLLIVLAPSRISARTCSAARWSPLRRTS